MDESNLKTAAKTVGSMCADFLLGGITAETFVSNLGFFAEQARMDLNANTDDFDGDHP